MSATNRGRVRLKDDTYVTPDETVMEFLNTYAKAHPAPKTILDPCCGGSKKSDGPYVKALKLFYPKAEIDAVDIRGSARATIFVDFLKWDTKKRYDFICSNPPYSMAQEFVTKSLSLLTPGGWVAMLLRLNFLGSQKRKEWWQAHPPRSIFIHTKRPSFKYGGTDATDYATFCWQNGCYLPLALTVWL